MEGMKKHVRKGQSRNNTTRGRESTIQSRMNKSQKKNKQLTNNNKTTRARVPPRVNLCTLSSEIVQAKGKLLQMKKYEKQSRWSRREQKEKIRL